jgi:hypothetical protein
MSAAFAIGLKFEKQYVPRHTLVWGLDLGMPSYRARAPSDRRTLDHPNLT